MRRLLSLLAAVILTLSFAPLALAATPNPGHDASSIGSGTFSAGNFAFPNNLTISGILGIGTATPKEVLEIAGNIRAGMSRGTPTTLADGTVNSAVTTLNVTNTSGYPSLGTVLIDSEAMTYTSVNGTAFLGVTRGALGTPAASHASAATVNAYLLTLGVNATTPRLVVTDAGNVGINTTSPTQLLDVRGNINATGTFYTPQICLNGNCQTSWPGASSGGVGNVSSSNGTVGYVARFTNSTNIATGTLYDNGTAIGIGNTQPNSTLHVGGTANITGALYSGGAFSTASTVTASGLITGNNGLTVTGTVTLPTGSITSAFILDGTVAAGDLATNAVTNAKYLDASLNSSKLNSTNSAGAGQYLTYGSAGQFTWATLPAGNGGNITPGAGSTLGNVAFWNNGSMINGTSNLYWDNANSRLGIGMTIPVKRLQINGSNNQIRLSSTNTSVDITSFDGGTGSDAYTDISPNTYNTTTPSYVRFFRLTNTTGTAAVAVLTADSSSSVNHFLSANANSYFAAVAGNVGIGNTQPNTTLEVSGTGRFSSTLTASNGFTLTAGTLSLPSSSISSSMLASAAVNATKLYISNSGSSGQVLTLNSSGGLNWSSAAGGSVTSVGFAVNGTSAFSVYNTPITSSGNLQINFQNATASQDGLLRSTDFSTFNTKVGQGANQQVTIDAANITSGSILDARLLWAAKWNESGSSNVSISGVVSYPLHYVSSTSAVGWLINSSDINSTNSAGAGQYLSYASNGQFTWATPGAASSGGGWTNTSTLVNLSTITNNIDANSLFIDNTNRRIGINTSTPANPLDISLWANNTNRTYVSLDGKTNAPDFQFKVGSDGGGHNGAVISALAFGRGSGTEDLRFETSNWGGSYTWALNSGNGTPYSYKVIGELTSSGSGAAQSSHIGQFTLYTVNDSQGGYTAGAGAGTANVRLSANGVSWLRGGDVGIGTSSPQRTLHVYNSTDSGSGTYIEIGNNNTGATSTDGLHIGGFWNGIDAQVWNYENGFLRFATNNVERMTIDSSGKVGIGTSAPNNTFVVAGTGNFTSTLFANNGFTLSSGSLSLPTGAVTSAMILDGTVATADITDGAITSLKYVDSSLNSTKINSTNSAGAGQYLSYGSNGQFTWVTPGAASAGGGWTNTSLLVSLSTAANNISAGTFFVDNTNSKVGVGTATPNQALQVVGNINVSQNLYYGGNLTGYGADFAEKLVPLEPVVPGDVVCLAGGYTVRKCTTRADAAIAGVVSTHATVIGNEQNAPDGVPVGIVGILETKVIGPIAVGDRITTSATAGYGERARDGEALIGKAMDACAAASCTVNVLVSLK